MPTAAIATAPARRDSSAIAAIASAVRSIGSGAEAAGRVEALAQAGHLGAIGELSTSVPSARRSPMCSLTELVPTSMTA